MSARSTISALGHSKQANQLREQLQGLLPDSAKPAVETAAQEAGDGLRKLLGYVELAVEYGQPVLALIDRLTGHAPVEAAPAQLPPPRRRFGWRSVVAVGVVVGIGALAYSMSNTSRSSARDA